ncbi:hypothetical protein [Nocardia mexicana]|uniref:Uncharacterized protein n=1 Tax=Nocardia mexicana TaxID=279262 RepID=A0A370H642_9NOCA|nr:hypothetical protein [Nocardia mexicana]RDI51684.1 hypothetical protein DFR68_104168 [Nocardia mexicana]
MDQFSAVPNRWPSARDTVFAEAAFGARPGIAAAELPAAASAAESWLRAVVLGGQGRYAAARAELRRTQRGSRDPVLRSLAVSTEASLLRQLGWHARAAVADGRAVGLVLAPDSRAAADPVRAEAICDGLTGLAADALGTARPNLAARLLDRCRAFLPAPSQGQRTVLRWHWVAAETALAAPGSGLIAEPALRHAETALAIAEDGPSVRHRVKSRLLVAAAAAAAGNLDRAREEAATVSAQCRENELLPLRWACAMLRSGVAAGPEAERAGAEARACAEDLAGRGGLLR